MWQRWIATDAQHLTAEFLIRLKPNRNRALSYLSLAMDTSTLTACGNDLGFGISQEI